MSIEHSMCFKSWLNIIIKEILQPLLCSDADSCTHCASQTISTSGKNEKRLQIITHTRDDSVVA